MKSEKDHNSPGAFQPHGALNHSSAISHDHTPQPWAVSDNPSPHDHKTPAPSLGVSPNPFPQHTTPHYGATPPSHLPKPQSHPHDHQAFQPNVGPYQRPPPLGATALPGNVIQHPGHFANGHMPPQQLNPPAASNSDTLPSMRDSGAFPHIDSYRPRKLSVMSSASDNPSPHPRLNPPAVNQSYASHTANGIPPLGSGHGMNGSAYSDRKRPADSTPPAHDSGAPEKQRLRVNRACDRCRMHKIKCSGTNPCSNCVKHGVDCMFGGGGEEPPQKKTRPPTYLSGSVTPMTQDPEDNDHAAEQPRVYENSLNKDSYTTFLENRVKYLENALLRDASGLPQSDAFPEANNYHEPEFDDFLKPINGKWRFCRRYQSALVVKLCASLYDELPPESQAQVAVPRINYYGWNMSGCKYLRPEKFPSPPDISSLSEAQLKDYVDYFFTAINPLYGVLHEKVFREQLDVFQKEQFEKPKTESTALFSAMITMVYAICIRFTEFQKPNGPSMSMLGLEEALFKYSYKVISIFSLEWESFELIQCWLLASLYLRVAYRQTSCISSLSNAISMCRSMGIGRFSKTFFESKPYEYMKAKRIFQATYIFDRCIGVLGGRCRGFNDQEVHEEFPALEDFEEEVKKDDWITPSSFAMIQIARLVSYIEIRSVGDLDIAATKRLLEKVQTLDTWLNENGFNDTDLFSGTESPEASLVKAQVKFHFYDLLHCLYGKKLFRYFGAQTTMSSTDDEFILRTSKRAVDLLKKVDHSGLLYTPWYLNLSSLVTSGVNTSVFLKVGIYTTESKRILQDIMVLSQKFQNSQVRDEKGRLVFRQRFKMAEEVVWLFKVINHLLSLSFEESIRSLQSLGIDHGSAEVNKRLFRQIGMYGRNSGGDLDKLMEDQNSRHLPNAKQRSISEAGTVNSQSGGEEALPQPQSSSNGGDMFLDNFAWFNQWVDFPYDV